MKLIMRTFLAITGFSITLLASTTFAQSASSPPEFSDYSVQTYSGKLRIPSYYVKSGDVWRDDMGKEVSPPKVNLAGRYYVGVHSCGTECRYFTLSDLTTGNDSKALDIFSSDGEHPPKTKDGRTYVTVLVTRPDSRMLVAQYHIEKSESKPEECHERVFLLGEDGKGVTPITATINQCQSK
jgi:hypothetical protein